MQVIKDNQSLGEAIAHLENVRRSEGILLKEHFQHTVHNLNPITMLKDKLGDTFSSPMFRHEIVQGALGVAGGLLTNKLVMALPFGGMLKKVLSSVVQTGLGKVALKKPSNIKKSGVSFLKNVLHKMKIEA
ncbi:hypothetical protein [Flavobacterium sp. GT3R68]|uniref:hypothetical protein n=1 Tax=Flavobacterium sp. GT3R68 TaxID=2594437 RepID=UPI000F89CB44|nr:hypothetical protein [Flavobacterium sp. GT3R68]RTY95034.1 hypothetical protein EKL32_08945 [Flavobacterium sp. GSN2]TRW91840.1 hypothetical protein FNW07_08120 [Flavobacterium sp. GT3R68]